MSDFHDFGWEFFAPDPRVKRWAESAYPAAVQQAADPAEQAKWLRHGKTWFVGVDSLPNETDGSIGGVPLQGPWDRTINTQQALHRAQVSVIYPGYPKRDPDETEAAHRFRRDMAAAHLDGLLPEGPTKRRHLREPHQWILGIPLNKSNAAPLIVWEGSHEIIRSAMLTAFAGVSPSDWGDVDVTDIYKDAREEVFETCDAVAVEMVPGQAVAVHRLAIHGVAPWEKGAKAPPEGRMIAYFRPVFDNPADWLRQP